MPESDSEANEFYRRSLEVLRDAEVPFLLGGAYALCIYTGIARHTKDFDLFVSPGDIDRALAAFRQVSYRAEKTFPHWLGKAFGSEDTIDIVFGMETGLCPPEEMDWDHLLRRFGPDWRVLLGHLILFGFIFPSEKERVPALVLEELLSSLNAEEGELAGAPLCRGTLLSGAQYLTEVSEGGWRDARLEPRAGLTLAEIEAWTQAIDPHVQPHEAAQED